MQRVNFAVEISSGAICNDKYFHQSIGHQAIFKLGPQGLQRE